MIILIPFCFQNFFGQVFRLLCSYSLVVPPKGSNVTAGELLESLMQTKDSLAVATVSKTIWLNKIDEIVENGYIKDENTGIFEHLLVNSDEETEEKDEIEQEELQKDPCKEHDYDVAYSSEYIVSYIAGYIARTMQRFSKCFACVESMQSKTPTARDKVIELMSEYESSLIYPSEELFKLIHFLENIILNTIGTKNFTFNSLHQVIEVISDKKLTVFVGCDEHKKELTKKIINNTLIMRGNFMAKTFNEKSNYRKIKTKRSRKLAKLL